MAMVMSKVTVPRGLSIEPDATTSGLAREENNLLIFNKAHYSWYCLVLGCLGSLNIVILRSWVVPPRIIEDI